MGVGLLSKTVLPSCWYHGRRGFGGTGSESPLFYATNSNWNCCYCCDDNSPLVLVLTDPAGAHSAEIKRLHVDPRPLIFLIWGGVVVRCLCNCCLFSWVYSHCAASTLEACAQSRPYQFKWIHGEPVCLDLFYSIHRISRFGRCCISVEQISKPLYNGFDSNSFVFSTLFAFG